MKKPVSTLITANQAIVSFDPLKIVSDVAVGVRGGRIDWVGSRDTEPPRPYEQRLDTAGWLMPGLVDSHVHLTFDSGHPDPVAHAVSSTSEQARATIADNARRFLRSGVTTVRDLGSPRGTVLEFAGLVESGSAHGPTVVAADQPLTRTRGHLWTFARQLETVGDVDACIADLAARGAKVIKVMVTGGRMTPGTAPEIVELRPDILAAAVARAHAEGLPVAAHSLGSDGIVAAVAAGVDTIEHGTFIERDGSPSPQTRVAQLAAQIADAGIFVCPTLNAKEGELDDHPISFTQRTRWVGELWERGARVIAGNDTGIPGCGPELYLGGLEALTRAGMPAEAVLHAATAMPALAMGMSHEFGTVETGMRADLLVVDGDPLSSLAFLRTPTLVMARGIVTENNRHEEASQSDAGTGAID